MAPPRVEPGPPSWEALEAPDLPVRMTLSCSFQCSGAAARRAFVPAVYRPSTQGLERGNGNFWGSMSGDLDLWIDEMCVAHASASCGDANRVVAARALAASSGYWSLRKGDLDCRAPGPEDRAHPTMILSPYDHSAHADVGDASVPGTPSPPRAALTGPMLDSGGSCATPINVSLCVGDCLPEGITHQTLAVSSTEPQELRVCGDALVHAHRGQAPVADRFELACRMYLWSSIHADASFQLLSSCAAARIGADCGRVYSVASQQ
jgi:hypothetical protein